MRKEAAMCRSFSTLFLAAMLFWPVSATAADTQGVKKYFAHPAVEDRDGVIAPWYRGPERPVRLPRPHRRRDAQTLSLGRQSAGGHAGAAFRLQRQWGIKPDGTIIVNPKLDDWDNGDVGQRSVSMLLGMSRLLSLHGRSGGHRADHPDRRLPAGLLPDPGRSSLARFPHQLPRRRERPTAGPTRTASSSWTSARSSARAWWRPTS